MKDNKQIQMIIISIIAITLIVFCEFINLKYSKSIMSFVKDSAKNTFLSPEETTKKLTSIEITNPPDITDYDELDSFDSTGMEVTARYDDNSSKIIENYVIVDGEELEIDQEYVTISYKEIEGLNPGLLEENTDINDCDYIGSYITYENDEGDTVKVEYVSASVEEYKTYIGVTYNIIESSSTYYYLYGYPNESTKSASLNVSATDMPTESGVWTCYKGNNYTCEEDNSIGRYFEPLEEGEWPTFTGNFELVNIDVYNKDSIYCLSTALSGTEKTTTQEINVIGEEEPDEEEEDTWCSDCECEKQYCELCGYYECPNCYWCYACGYCLDCCTCGEEEECECCGGDYSECECGEIYYCECCETAYCDIHGLQCDCEFCEQCGECITHGVCTCEETTILNFKDKNLYNAIKEYLNNNSYDYECDDENMNIKIQDSDLIEINSLDLSYKKIEKIDGLEYFTGLDDLDLSSNNITDISLLSEYSILTLNIANNPIEKIEKLSECTDLTMDYIDNINFGEDTCIEYLTVYIDASCNEVNLPDIFKRNAASAIFENCTISEDNTKLILNEETGNTNYLMYFDEYNLEYKIIRKKLTDIEITKAPTKTSYIEGENFDSTGMKVIVNYNNGSSKEITDYEITNGDNLQANQTTVTVSYEENDKTITTTQEISVEKVNIKFKDENLYNKIIEKLNAEGYTYKKSDQIKGIKLGESDIEKITSLDLAGANIRELDGLEKFTNIRSLELNDNEITDISKLSNLIHLYALDLSNNKINNIASLSSLILLKDLNVSNNQISSIESLSNLILLEILDISKNQIESIDSLKNKSFEKLTLDYNSNVDLSSITGSFVMYVKSDCTEIIMPNQFKNEKDVATLNNCSTSADGTKLLLYDRIQIASVYYCQSNVRHTYIIKKETSEEYKNKNLVSIEVKEQPYKTVYKTGEDFDTTGMKVVAKYDDGSEEEITNYKLLDGNNLSDGRNSLTIYYSESDFSTESKELNKNLAISFPSVFKEYNYNSPGRSYSYRI